MLKGCEQLTTPSFSSRKKQQNQQNQTKQTKHKQTKQTKPKNNKTKKTTKPTREPGPGGGLGVSAEPSVRLLPAAAGESVEGIRVQGQGGSGLGFQG